MMHGSFGTLGVLSKLTFRLMPAKPFVQMTYETFGTLQEYKNAIWQHYEDRDVDFMDGIIHAADKHVLCLGSFTDRAPYASSYEWMKIYYKSTLSRKTDYMKTADYYFRYDTDAHWMAGTYGMEIPLLRFLFGRQVLTSTKMLETARNLRFFMKKSKPDVVIDVFVPFCNLDRFFEIYMQEFKYFPIWIVPFKIKDMYPWVNPELVKDNENDLYIDVAIYGMKQGNKNYYKRIEEILLEVNGTKTLISYNYYDEETFWKSWSKENYTKVKQQVDPDNIFRDLYSKTNYSK
jgi:FAD/FMN-containing dehydrogenase